MTIDVIERFELARARMEALNLYALVDGAIYQLRRGQQLNSAPGMVSLFAGTSDEPLAHAGPWLIDTAQTKEMFVRDLARLEQEAPVITWILSEADLSGLYQLLQLRLDTRLPDGRLALLRFWDPRVLPGLITLMTTEQRDTFFAHIHEWHFLDKGRRVWIGRQYAEAH
ncbi:conserved hypothetical protein [Cupriavidus taiwanensis]|uniref:DUF4123 domain-containing protein n=1 Tax=Cupriavidus taiwanensis TaxID=164546 RepID=UPI000E1A0AF5|nr:DUF4123 domain-containing protein [Cupriavidus taiwanensis]SOZ14647.1 conserved hypothetical protein [Cupriavidus taiwanensis]SOZ26357.1 conserved hypothetical protein [Cupriavidus taiwanensis]SOZ45221.1 conserved hypothetical protein [Cupriavidus taiwanensis]